jgi:hypothetical protein
VISGRCINVAVIWHRTIWHGRFYEHNSNMTEAIAFWRLPERLWIPWNSESRITVLAKASTDLAFRKSVSQSSSQQTASQSVSQELCPIIHLGSKDTTTKLQPGYSMSQPRFKLGTFTMQITCVTAWIRRLCSALHMKPVTAQSKILGHQDACCGLF